MKMKRSARLLAVAALAATLVACTGSDEPPDGPASADPTSSGSPSTAAADESRVAVPPADKVRQAFTVPVPTYRDEVQRIDMLGPVFTADLILVTDDHNFLHAIDRATGQERWRVKRRSAGQGDDTPCALALPTPDAEVIVMNHGAGALCGEFTVYSLADGSITEKYDSVSRLGRRINFELGRNSDLVDVEGRTYYLDADNDLLRFEADGTTSSLGSATGLVDADEEWTTAGLSVLPGSDVLVSRLLATDGEVEFDEDEDGMLIGFRVGADDLLELVWEQDIPQLLSEQSSPGHVFGKFEISDDVPGMIVDLQRTKGRELVRHRILDPQTGDLGNPGFTYARKNPPDLPGFYTSVVPGRSLRSATDSTIFTSVTVRGTTNPSAVRRLDLDSGEVVWSWPIPGAGKAIQTGAQVVSSSADGSLVYVRTSVDIDNRLWELDAATGEPVRSWKFSGKAPEALDLVSATVSLDNGDIFQFGSTTSVADVLGALYR